VLNRIIPPLNWKINNYLYQMSARFNQPGYLPYPSLPRIYIVYFLIQNGSQMWTSLPLHKGEINVENWDVGSRAWKVVCVVCRRSPRQQPGGPSSSTAAYSNAYWFCGPSAVTVALCAPLRWLFTSAAIMIRISKRATSQGSTWWHQPKTKKQLLGEKVGPTTYTHIAARRPES